MNSLGAILHWHSCPLFPNYTKQPRVSYALDQQMFMSERPMMEEIFIRIDEYMEL